MKLFFSEEKKSDFFVQKGVLKLGEANLELLKQFFETDLLPVMDGVTGEELAIPVWGQTVPYGYAAELAKNCRKKMVKPKATPADIEKAIIDVFGIKDESFPVCKDKNGTPIPDPDLKDFENVPFTEDYDTYMQREVLPFAPDTWIDETIVDWGTATKKIPLGDGKVGVVGTNISFNKYFYKYNKPGDPKVIAREIRKLEEGLESFLEGVL
jgi:type I restriction enzyme M protein